MFQSLCMRPKKTMRMLGLDYEKIHACKNDCIMFCKEYAYLNKCPTCGESRWKNKKKNVKTSSNQAPAKVLWYFPPIPRFKCMF